LGAWNTDSLVQLFDFRPQRLQGDSQLRAYRKLVHYPC